MAKKNFTGSTDSLLGSNTKKAAPTSTKKKTEKEPDSNLETIASYRINKILAEKIKRIAHLEGAKIKEVVEEAFSHLVERYEEENGEIKLRTKKKGFKL